MTTKKKRILLISVIIMTIILFTFLWINSILQNIQEDWKREFNNKKTFLKELSFSGKVIKHLSVREKVYPPFALAIKLDTTVTMPSWGDSFYYEFYNFDLDKRILKISVPESVYRDAKLNDSVMKKAGSDSIQVNHYTYLLLSKKNANWIPNKE